MACQLQMLQKVLHCENWVLLFSLAKNLSTGSAVSLSEFTSRPDMLNHNTSIWRSKEANTERSVKASRHLCNRVMSFCCSPHNWSLSVANEMET